MVQLGNRMQGLQASKFYFRPTTGTTIAHLGTVCLFAFLFVWTTFLASPSSSRLIGMLTSGFCLIFAALQLRKEVYAQNGVLFVVNGVNRRQWKMDDIQQLSCEVTFASRSGVLFNPQEVEIYVEFSSVKRKRVCTSFYYGATKTIELLAALSRLAQKDPELIFRFAPNSEESRHIVDGDQFSVRTRELLQRRFERSLFVGAALIAMSGILSLRYESWTMFALYSSILIVVFGSIMFSLQQGKRSLISPSLALKTAGFTHEGNNEL